MILVGKPTKGYKTSTMVLLIRPPRSKWWQVACFGPKGHYAKDGSCAHTDAVLAQLRPDAPRERIRLLSFGDDARKTVPAFSTDAAPPVSNDQPRSSNNQDSEEAA